LIPNPQTHGINLLHYKYNKILNLTLVYCSLSEIVGSYLATSKLIQWVERCTMISFKYGFTPLLYLAIRKHSKLLQN
jgi:hypothetical protein